MKYYYINDDLTEDALVSCNDRGFRFGDGVFETIRVMNYKPYLFQYHMERLERGLIALKIRADMMRIKRKVLKLIEVNRHQQGVVRIIVTRGVGSIGYLPESDILPTVFIETGVVNFVHGEPVNICVSSFEKVSINSLPTGVKLLQGLNSILSKIEAREKGCFDGLLLNNNKELCEVSSGNIFWVKDNQIYTPKISCGLVAGVIRRRIMEMFEVITGSFLLKTILDADEVFITNSVWLVLPVKQIGKAKFCSPYIASIVQNRILEDQELYCA